MINKNIMINNSQKGFGTPIIIGIVLVLVIGGIFYFTTKQKSSTDESMMKKDEVMIEKDETMMEKDGEMMKKNGEMMKDESAMVKYSGTVLAGKSAPLLDFKKADYDAVIKADKLIVLYFYANWCPICKLEFPKMQTAFNELKTDKVVGFRVNYNDNETDTGEEDLAREFGVAYQHTKVFIKNGQRVLKSPEGWDEERYNTEIGSRL